jgi:hypothetical protein
MFRNKNAFRIHLLIMSLGFLQRRDKLERSRQNLKIITLSSGLILE